ncbi:MAG TPA: peptidoglycan DD-metalloendopeptidase family protein [Anaerolineae bacterium]|nr:peptidoglycan DD-metalloendopeptidase family protein [Anaerolineae bacterium]
MRIWRSVRILLASGLLLLLCFIFVFRAWPSIAEDDRPKYGTLTEMRLPWAHGDAEPRMLTQDWWQGHEADGLAWDFGRSASGAPVAGTEVLAPMAGYVTAVRQQDPGYGNYVDVQGEQDWVVRLAHLQQQSGVRSEFAGIWIPRGVPIGQLGNTGSADYPYHIHVELLWRGGRPPATGNDYPDDYLPADSQPFGLPRSSLQRPMEDREIVSNQDRYRPTLDVSWPLRGCAVVKGRTSYLSFFAVEPSKLHQYRWHVTRATDHTTVAESDWSDSPDSGDSLQALERGEYEWWAQVRFPDIRYGHEREWFESDSRAERFRVLDLANPFDWPLYLYYRLLSGCLIAAPRAAPDNPPTPLPPPSVVATEQPSPTPTAVAAPPTPANGRIAFISYLDGNSDVYVMNADGSALTNVTKNPAYDVDPTWSPDGRRIAFASDRVGNYEIYVMNADGSGLIRLTNQLATDWEPSWSPDGQQITFV